MLFSYGTITKNTPATITLSKSDLFALVTDSYFSIPANVKSLIAVYESDSSDEKEVLTFDLSQATPTATFLISEKARGSFLLQDLILNDHDNGSFVIKRSDLPQSVITQNGTIVSGGVTSYSFQIVQPIIDHFNAVTNDRRYDLIQRIVLATTDGQPPRTDSSGNNLNLILANSYVLSQNGTRVNATSVSGSGVPLTLSASQIYTPNNNDFSYRVDFDQFSIIIFKDLFRVYSQGGTYNYYDSVPMRIGITLL